jgi:hypothetical protein
VENTSAALARVMDDNAVVDQAPAGIGDAPVAPVFALPGWSSAAHLSPAAAFEPGRVDLCTPYQLAAIDSTNTAAYAHLSAAMRHVAEAVNVAGGEHQGRIRDQVVQLEQEITRLRRKVGI